MRVSAGAEAPAHKLDIVRRAHTRSFPRPFRFGLGGCPRVRIRNSPCMVARAAGVFDIRRVAAEHVFPADQSNTITFDARCLSGHVRVGEYTSIPLNGRSNHLENPLGQFAILAPWSAGNARSAGESARFASSGSSRPLSITAISAARCVARRGRPPAARTASLQSANTPGSSETWRGTPRTCDCAETITGQHQPCTRGSHLSLLNAPSADTLNYTAAHLC